MENIFVDKDKDNIASSLQIGCQKIERDVYKFLIFGLEFHWTIRYILSLEVLDIITYLYKGQ